MMTIAILETQRDRMKHRAKLCEVPFNEDGYTFTKTADVIGNLLGPSD